MNKHSISRRSFLRNFAMATAAASVVRPLRLWGQDAPNSQITVGCIGMGAQMRGLLGSFLGRNETRVLAVCDVDGARRDAAKNRVDSAYQNHDCMAYEDFREIMARKDIDAVCIATPDHWHAIPTLAALRAGKDVFCEKPLTHNIHEAVEIIQTAAQTNRILQTGAMQRSMKEFRVACELVRNGVIGNVRRIRCGFGEPPVACDLPEESMEPNLNWDMWCGPAPLRGYNSILSPRGVHSNFPAWRKYKEFGTGGVGDWGAHQLDIAQWALDQDAGGPVEVQAPSDPTANFGCRLIYANGIPVEHIHDGGVSIFGDDGEIYVHRGAFKLVIKGETLAEFAGNDRTPSTSCEREVALMEKRFLQNPSVSLYKSKNHIADFLDCVKTRKKPISNEMVGAHSAICCHLMNQSYFNRASFKWDPVNYQFAANTGNPSWLTSPARAPWTA